MCNTDELKGNSSLGDVLNKNVRTKFILDLGKSYSGKEQRIQSTWQSNYALGAEGFCLSVTGFRDGTILFEAATDGDDIVKEFGSLKQARKFIDSYVGNEQLECDSKFDFMLDEPKF